MIKYTCIHKIRDGKGNIVGYKLKDESGRIIQVSSRDLKNQISNGKVQVENLTLTSDGRLVDAAEEKEKQAKQVNDIDRKILNYIEACKIIGIKPLTIEKMGEDYVIVGLPSNERNIQIPEFATAIRLNTKLSDNNGDNQYINKFTSFEIERILRELLNRLYKNDENQITIEDIQKILSDEHKEIKELINEKSADSNKILEDQIDNLTKSLEAIEKDIVDELKSDNDETIKEIIEFMKSGDAQVAIKKAEKLEPVLLGAMKDMLDNDKAYIVTKSAVLPEKQEDLEKKLDGVTYELYKSALDSEERYNEIKGKYAMCSHMEECKKAIVSRVLNKSTIRSSKLDCEITGTCMLSSQGKSYDKISLGCEVSIDKKEELTQYINYSCNYFLELYNMFTREYDIRQDINMEDTQVFMDLLSALSAYTLGLTAFMCNIGDVASKGLTDAGDKTIAYGKTATGISGIIGGALNTGKAIEKLLNRRAKRNRTNIMFKQSFKTVENIQEDMKKYSDEDIFRFVLEYIFSESKAFSDQIGDASSGSRKDRGLLHKEILKTVYYLKRDNTLNKDLKLNVIVAYLAAYLYIKNNFNFTDNYAPEYLVKEVSACNYKNKPEIYNRHKVFTVMVREYMLFNLHIMGINSNLIYGKILKHFNVACKNCDIHIITAKPSRIAINSNGGVVGMDINKQYIKMREIVDALSGIAPDNDTI